VLLKCIIANKGINGYTISLACFGFEIVGKNDMRTL